MPPKQPPSMTPKRKRELVPSKFSMPRRPVQHRVIKGRRREAMLNARDVRDEMYRTQEAITRIQQLGPAEIARRRLSSELGRLNAKKVMYRNELDRLLQQAAGWDDIYQAGGGDQYFPPPPPPPAGGGIAV